MFGRDPSCGAPVPAGPRGRVAERRRSTATLLAAIMAEAARARDPRAARDRLVDALRGMLHARAVVLREVPTVFPPTPPHTVACDVPIWTTEGRARLEAVFEAPRPLDAWSWQLLTAAAQLAALLLELERAGGRGPAASRPADGAAPLIGSSAAIRAVRERIERVAGTDFTILIEGAIGPESHPSFIEVSRDVALRDRHGEVAGAREDGAGELAVAETLKSLIGRS